MSTNKTAMWKRYNESIEERNASGTGTLSATISGTPIIDNGDGTVQIATTAAHGFVANSWVVIEGTTSYDGMHKTVSGTSDINITTDYVAETPAGTETIRVGIEPDCPFQLLEVNIHLSAAATSSGNYTIDKDAEAGSAWDINIATEDLITNQDYSLTSERFFMDGDAVIASYDNPDSRTWGVDFTYRKAR